MTLLLGWKMPLWGAVRGNARIDLGHSLIYLDTPVSLFQKYLMKKLYIVDGHALCYRAYYAFIQNPLLNSKGQNVSAIFGFFRMLLKLIEDQKPDYFAVAFDPKKKSFRFQEYPEYKANRLKMPDDLRSQIDEIQRSLEAMSVPVLIREGFEADDVLGSLSHQYAGTLCDVVIVTGDKDAYQLVNKNVTIYANKKGIADFEVYGSDEVKEKTGVTPEQIIDYMALTGDTSDNIPGVKGVGAKTAAKLVAEYGSLDGIYQNIDKIKGKTSELLATNKENAYLSKNLVTIRTDVEIGAALEDFDIAKFDKSAARTVFETLEMKSINKEFFGAGTEIPTAEEEKPILSVANVPHSYIIIKSIEQLSSVCDEITRAGFLSVDTETTSVRPVDAELVGVSLSIKAHEAWYVPVSGDSLFGGEGLLLEDVVHILKPVLENSKILKVGQNIKYDMIVFAHYGIHLSGIRSDSMIGSYLLDPTAHRHSLDDMALDRLGYKTILFEELAGKGKKAVTLRDVPVDKVAEYSCEDADIALQLCQLIDKELAGKGLDKLYREMEIPLVEVLSSMEFAGIRIDREYFSKLAVEIDSRISATEKAILDLAGEVFNLNSTKELSRILFQKLELKTVKKTKTGFSTDIKVLEELKGSHPIIDHLIDYRMLAKLKGTYVDALPELISPNTGRIHTSFNQTIVATGRLSSSDPNLQNIPAKDDFGKQLRKGFIAGKGCVLISADYSQIELRIAAHLSGDENMRRAFLEKIDIHSMTASSVFSVELANIEPWMRRQAKIINFATIYGVTAYGLSRQADLSVKDAAQFIERYFKAYPGFKDYMEKTKAFAHENGYVETMFGRRRSLPDIHSSAVFVREGAERIAVNTPIQGSSADIIKIAMINLHRAFSENKMKSRIILQVHDELVCEVPVEEKDFVEGLIRDCMQNAVTLSVPLIVEIGCGASWGDAH
jgi:DNA polymerase I